MYKYDGLVIYQHHDDEGVLEVVEEKGIRSLHFGTSSRQSCLDLNDPESLQLSYIRAMTSWLLFKESVENALIIGLGGGSLARFLLYHFPECWLKAVEYRASVVKIARSHFGLPLDSRLKVVIGDGSDYVLNHEESHKAQSDLILVDAFDYKGLSSSVASLAFFEGCRRLLKSHGIMVVNFWGSDKKMFNLCCHWLTSVFEDRVLLLPVYNRGNVIALTFMPGLPVFEFKALKTRALLLEQRYQIEFPKFINDIKNHNSLNLHSVIKK